MLATGDTAGRNAADASPGHVSRQDRQGPQKKKKARTATASRHPGPRPPGRRWMMNMLGGDGEQQGTDGGHCSFQTSLWKIPNVPKWVEQLKIISRPRHLAFVIHHGHPGSAAFFTHFHLNVILKEISGILPMCKYFGV